MGRSCWTLRTRKGLARGCGTSAHRAFSRREMSAKWPICRRKREWLPTHGTRRQRAEALARQMHRTCCRPIQWSQEQNPTYAYKVLRNTRGLHPRQRRLRCGHWPRDRLGPKRDSRRTPRTADSTYYRRRRQLQQSDRWKRERKQRPGLRVQRRWLQREWLQMRRRPARRRRMHLRERRQPHALPNRLQLLPPLAKRFQEMSVRNAQN
jgi:hypothetical protein